MTEHLPDFSLEDVLTVLHEAYECNDRARIGDLIAVLCADGRATVLRTDRSGVAASDLAGALAVLQIDFQEFLTQLGTLRRGNGAAAGQN